MGHVLFRAMQSRCGLPGVKSLLAGSCKHHARTWVALGIGVCGENGRTEGDVLISLRAMNSALEIATAPMGAGDPCLDPADCRVPCNAEKAAVLSLTDVLMMDNVRENEFASTSIAPTDVVRICPAAVRRNARMVSALRVRTVRPIVTALQGVAVIERHSSVWMHVKQAGVSVDVCAVMRATVSKRPAVEAI